MGYRYLSERTTEIFSRAYCVSSAEAFAFLTNCELNDGHSNGPVNLTRGDQARA